VANEKADPEASGLLRLDCVELDDGRLVVARVSDEKPGPDASGAPEGRFV